MAKMKLKLNGNAQKCGKILSFLVFNMVFSLMLNGMYVTPETWEIISLTNVLIISIRNKLSEVYSTYVVNNHRIKFCLCLVLQA